MKAPFTTVDDGAAPLRAACEQHAPVRVLQLTSRMHDLAIGPILVVIGMMALAVALTIPFIEAVVLKLIGWDQSWRRCVRDAWIANVVSTCVGLAFATLLLEWNALTAFASMFAATVVIEAVVLAMLDTKNEKPVLLAALLPNVVTYLLLAPVWFGIFR